MYMNIRTCYEDILCTSKLLEIDHRARPLFLPVTTFTYSHALRTDTCTCRETMLIHTAQRGEL